MLVGSLLTAFGDERDPEPPRTNIVLFYVDDLGWRDLGCMGSDFYETPHIDALAADGVVFTSAYANAPNCAPSRACLMSGQYTPRHGVYTVGNSTRGDVTRRRLIPTPNTKELTPESVTVAETLKAAGYVTATMGKWHLGPDPREHGFDVNVAGNRTGSPRGGHFSPYRNPQLPNGPDGEHLTDRLTDEAVRFIEEHREQPFFLYLTHYAVHTPIQAKDDLVEKYQDKPAAGGHKNPKYAAMIDSVDQSVGRVMKALEDAGVAEHTLFVFFSDNGGHGNVTSMAPLRGAKGMLYEGGVRVPMIARWPGRASAGARCDVPVIGVDLYPTFLAAAGASPPPDHELDGEDITTLLAGQDAGQLADRPLFWHFPAYLQATRRRAEEPFRTRPAGAVRAGDYKLLEFFEDGRLELYDLKQDIGETNDLSEREREVTAALHARLKAWRASVDAPVPSEPNPKFVEDGRDD